MLALLGRDVVLVEPPASDQDWYANLLWHDRRKCLLVTHAGTLFSVFAADVRAADLRPLGRYLAAILETELRSEGLPADALGPLDANAVQVSTTASRSVLGFMNDMAAQIGYAVDAAGGLDRLDVPDMNRHLRRIPYDHGGYVYPIDHVRHRFDARPRARGRPDEQIAHASRLREAHLTQWKCCTMIVLL